MKGSGGRKRQSLPQAPVGVPRGRYGRAPPVGRPCPGGRRSRLPSRMVSIVGFMSNIISRSLLSAAQLVPKMALLRIYSHLCSQYPYLATPLPGAVNRPFELLAQFSMSGSTKNLRVIDAGNTHNL